MTRWIGRYLVGVGVFHNAAALVLYARPLREIVAAGGWNTVYPQWDRNAAFWFVIAGLTFMLLGAVVDWIEGRGLALPRRLGWGLLALTVLGAFCFPVSAFWAILPPAVAALRRAAPGV